MSRAGHPEEIALRGVARGAGAPDAVEHVDSCATCRASVDTIRELAALRGADGLESCPDALQLVALAHHELTEADRALLLRHAGRCGPCTVALDVLAADVAGSGADAPPVEAALRDRVGASLASLSKALAALSSFQPPPVLALQSRGQGTATTLAEALAAVHERRFAEAVALLREVIAGGEKDASARFHLGACLVALGELDEGIEHLAKAARTRRDLAEYAWHHAQALLLAGRGEAALAELKRCARLPGPRAEDARELALRVAALLGTH
jgi:tetratricopeptide (TPR) repeat protein